MAKLRREDYGRKLVDEDLEKLEEKLGKLYTQATYELDEKLSSYFAKFAEEDEKKLSQLAAGEITNAEYEAWRRGRIIGQESWFNMRDRIAQDLTHYDQIAAKMINDELPNVYATSHNFGAFDLEMQSAVANVDLSPFTIYNTEAVKMLMKDDPDLLPSLTVDRNRDLQWNRQHIQSAVAQGIIQGDSMDKIASRLQRVTEMDRNAAIRNARTATNGAENAGRQAIADQCAEQGIPMVKEWNAVKDAKTRDSHLLVDGEQREENERFSNGLMYAGDPSGDPSEVYNCRCATLHLIKGIDHRSDYEKYQELMKAEHYDDWLKAREAEQDDASWWHNKNLEQEYGEERQARLRGEVEDKWDNTLTEEEVRRELDELFNLDRLEGTEYSTENAAPLTNVIDDVIMKNGRNAQMEFLHECNDSRIISDKAMEDAFFGMRPREDVLQEALDEIHNREKTVEYEGREFSQVNKVLFPYLHDEQNIKSDNEGHIYSRYVGTSNSWDINSTLRNDGIEALSERDRTAVEALMESIADNPLQGDLLLTRNVDENALASMLGVGGAERGDLATVLRHGTADDILEIGKSLVGTTYEERQLVSASTDPKANVFGDRRVQLQLLTPAGTPCYITNNDWESEAILGIGTQYKFVGAEVEENRGNNILILKVLVGGEKK